MFYLIRFRDQGPLWMGHATSHIPGNRCSQRHHLAVCKRRSTFGNHVANCIVNKKGNTSEGRVEHMLQSQGSNISFSVPKIRNCLGIASGNFSTLEFWPKPKLPLTTTSFTEDKPWHLFSLFFSPKKVTYRHHKWNYRCVALWITPPLPSWLSELCWFTPWSSVVPVCGSCDIRETVPGGDGGCRSVKIHMHTKACAHIYYWLSDIGRCFGN